MPTRHRTSLCREGWYLLLLLAVVLTWALLRENNLLLLVAGLMCGALLVNWRLSAAALAEWKSDGASCPERTPVVG